MSQLHLPSTTSDEHTWAFASHALTFFEGGVVGPLAIYLWKRPESEFVAYHALQSFYFGVVAVLVSLLSCGILALPMLVVYVLYELKAAMAANNGEWYALPLAGEWASRSHNAETVRAKAAQAKNPPPG